MDHPTPDERSGADPTPDAPDTAGAAGAEGAAGAATPETPDTTSSPGRIGLRQFSRRQVLTMAGAGGLVGAGLLANRWINDEPTSATSEVPRPTTTAPPATAAETTVPPAPEPPPVALWSDPATWGGTVPGEADVVVSQRFSYQRSDPESRVLRSAGPDRVFPTCGRTTSPRWSP